MCLNCSFGCWFYHFRCSLHLPILHFHIRLCISEYQYHMWQYNCRNYCIVWQLLKMYLSENGLLRQYRCHKQYNFLLIIISKRKYSRQGKSLQGWEGFVWYLTSQPGVPQLPLAHVFGQVWVPPPQVTGHSVQVHFL